MRESEKRTKEVASAGGYAHHQAKRLHVRGSRVLSLFLSPGSDYSLENRFERVQEDTRNGHATKNRAKSE